MHSLADIACFQKWATPRSCAAKTDAWQVFALHNLGVAIETTSTTDDLLSLSASIIESRNCRKEVVISDYHHWRYVCRFSTGNDGKPRLRARQTTSAIIESGAMRFFDLLDDEFNELVKRKFAELERKHGRVPTIPELADALEKCLK
jgi:hypothetical protein